MSTAYIGLGSNLGDRWAALQAALRRLRAEPGLRVLAISRIYDSTPVDCPPGSGDFLNAVVTLETELAPAELLQFLHQIERQSGRIRTETNAPRTLDLDLLLYDDRIIDTKVLAVPHPRMHERAFVLVPLAEIAADAVHPRLGRSIGDLLARVAKNAVRIAERPQGSPGKLRGLRALVTGSTAGIGRAIADAMIEQGAEVFTHGRRMLQGGWHLTADLADPCAVDRLAEMAWNPAAGLDVLVLNAGADTLTGEAAKWSFDQKLDALLAVDLKAAMRLARDLGARMKERGRGSILTIGWDQVETGMEGDSGQLFGAVKSAVMGFTKSLALTLAPEVRVNCIAPGWIRTAWGEAASGVWQERVRRETPLGIWGLPEDVAEAAVWLASPAAAFITGQIIRVNGGAVRA